MSVDERVDKENVVDVSVQFSCSVMSDSLGPHESQHAKPLCPSLSPRVHSDSCPSSRWCHPAISSSVVPFSSCPQSLSASEFFPVSQLFAWGGRVYNGILVSCKKEGNLAICNNVDGPKGHYAKWNKSDRRWQISYDLIYMWNLKMNEPMNQPTNQPKNWIHR